MHPFSTTWKHVFKGVEKGCIGNEWVKAEIIWLLKSVLSEYSLRFNDDVGDTLCAMYPGFDSLQNFSTSQWML